MKRLQSRLPKILMWINGIKCGKNLKLHGYPVVFRFPDAQMQFGDDVTLNSNFWSNMLGLYQRTIIVARGTGRIQIGNHVGMSGVTLYARTEIQIGDHTIIGANTKIFDNDFHSLNEEERINNNYDSLVCQPVTIGKNVFIGCNCIILKGTEIGDGCIIGAGSVVHGKFGCREVIAGNPARIISGGGYGTPQSKEVV